MYRQLGEDVPAVCREPGYRDEMVRAYPFHPELISVLYERWGSIPEFQRTRGVLRLLADVISNLYQAKDNEVLIQSGSVNLGAAAVRGELVKHTDSGSVFQSVIESDISGSHAKAPEIDRQLGSEYAKENVAEKLARAVAAGVRRGLFAYALGDGEKKEFDTIYFNSKAVGAVDCEVTETAWLVRTALARTLMPEPEQKTVTPGGEATGGTGPTTTTGGGGGAGGGPGAGPGDDEWSDKGGKVVIKEGERRLNKVRVEIKNLPWDSWHDIYNEVIQPLANEGAEIHCQLVVIAKGDAAIRENTVELGIKESLGQRDIQADIQTG